MSTEAETSQNNPDGGNLFATSADTGVFEVGHEFTADTMDELLEWCVMNKVADVTIQTGLPVFGDVAGELGPITERALRRNEVENGLMRIFGDQAPGQMQNGEALDGSYEFRSSANRKIRNRFRVNATPIRAGMQLGVQITLRALPETPPRITDLGIEDDILDNWIPDQGVILVTGPTGSGKSTLLASGIRHILERPNANDRIVEYSAPVEYVYDHIKPDKAVIAQSGLGDHLKGSFSEAVSNALRRKPDRILIGEARDKETVHAVLHAGLSGHTVYSTLHTIGVPETVRRMMVEFAGAEMHARAVDLAESLRMVVTQRLIPKLEGGQVGIREYMIFDAHARKRLLQDVDPGAWPERIREMMRNGEVRGQTMGQAARKHYDAGEISQEWYLSLKARDEDEV